jgi:hypothetical protein
MAGNGYKEAADGGSGGGLGDVGSLGDGFDEFSLGEVLGHVVGLLYESANGR